MSPGRRSRPRRWGLRRRLNATFTFVALAAVALSTWTTLGAVASLAHDLTDRTSPTFLGNAWSDPEQGAEQLGERAFRRVTWTSLWAASVAVALAAVVAAVVTRRLTRPLVALTDGARRLAEGERHVRVRPPAADDELRTLAVAFNGLVEGLERQEAWRRDLVADIAHDLRTPLAVLRSEIEAMQDGVRSVDDAALARLHVQVIALAGLVADLRTLSLAEGGGLDLHPEAIDGPAFLHEVVAAFASRAAETKSELRVTGDRDWTLWGDRTHLRRLLANLVDNALHHAPGLVEIGGGARHGGVELWVRDHGPGLSDEALERAFERFYRQDASRTRRSDGDRGSGLGLAIVRAVAEAHGGRVEVTNEGAEGSEAAGSGGARFVVRLPAGPHGAAETVS